MTIIRDELLEPYFIGKDAYCYTAYEVITPQKKYLAKGSKVKIMKNQLVIMLILEMPY